MLDVTLTDTMSAMALLVFPWLIPSLIVIGRSSLILSSAAGQSSWINAFIIKIFHKQNTFNSM